MGTRPVPAALPAPSIGAAPITFTTNVVSANGNIRAFVETGSASLNILATLRECNPPTPGAVKAMYCAPRKYGADWGVVVTVFFDTPPPANLDVEISLYQGQAKG